MQSTKTLLQRYSAKFKDADDITLRGYMQMPRVVLYSEALSDSDKVVHLLLLSYAWQDPTCHPHQATLGDVRGKSDRQIRRNLKSLETHGYVKIEQRGAGLANRYQLLCRVGRGGIILPPEPSSDCNVSFDDADDFTIGGFVKVPRALLEDANLSDGAILTYAVIADQGRRCPSQTKMATERGIKRVAFSTQVNELVRHGYVEVSRPGYGSTLNYKLRFKFVKNGVGKRETI